MISHYREKLSYDFLNKSQWWTKEEIETLQLEGLNELIKYAKNSCPFYSYLPDSVSSLDDLKKIPILTKKQIHDNYDILWAKQIPSYKIWTGGTSEVVNVQKPSDMTPITNTDLRIWSWVTEPHLTWTRQAVVWGAGELGHGGSHPVEPFRSIGKNPYGKIELLFCPIEQMVNEQTIVNYLRVIQEFAPYSIRAYASAMRSLSFYALKYNIKIPTLKCFINNCEPLSEDIRKLTNEAFEVPVFNYYGSQDLGAMGGECYKHEGIHLTMERYILQPMKDGRFIWTDLLNYAMPLVRYENGDVGKYSEHQCSCGRGLLLLENIVGRTLQYLWTKQNGWLNMTELNESMYYDIKDFLMLIEAHQVQQDEQGKAMLLVKAWDINHVPDFTRLVKHFSDRIDIEVRYVDAMARSRSGKQLACISKFKPPWVNTNNWDENQNIELRGDV
jgi:phenylacetate-CoA ligase